MVVMMMMMMMTTTTTIDQRNTGAAKAIAAHAAGLIHMPLLLLVVALYARKATGPRTNVCEVAITFTNKASAVAAAAAAMAVAGDGVGVSGGGSGGGVDVGRWTVLTKLAIRSKAWISFVLKRAVGGAQLVVLQLPGVFIPPVPWRATANSSGSKRAGLPSKHPLRHSINEVLRHGINDVLHCVNDESLQLRLGNGPFTSLE
eukprot:gene17729-biopygen5141